MSNKQPIGLVVYVLLHFQASWLKYNYNIY